MKQVVLGPTFTGVAAMGVDEAGDRLEEAFRAADRLVCRRTGTHLLVSFGAGRRHFWSPWLTLDLTPTDEGGCSAHGRFNPSPGIWTGFMLAALAMVTVAGSGVVWALAEWTLGRPMLGLWGTGVGSVGLVVLFAVSASGQRLAKDEIDEMERLVLATIDAIEHGAA